MHIDLNKIIHILDGANITADKRGAILSLGLARAIGYNLDLPTSPVDDPVTFYISNVQSLAETVVSQVNEQVAIDVRKTCDLIKAVWTFRYRLVYQANNPTVRAFLDGLVKVGSTEFPGYVSELMICVGEDNLLDYIAGIMTEAVTTVANESAAHINNQAVYGRVFSLAEGRFGSKRGTLKPETRIKQDLKASDHDLEKFITSVEKAFKVDLVGDNVDNYAKYKTLGQVAQGVIKNLSR